MEPGFCLLVDRRGPVCFKNDADVGTSESQADACRLNRAETGGGFAFLEFIDLDMALSGVCVTDDQGNRDLCLGKSLGQN